MKKGEIFFDSDFEESDNWPKDPLVSIEQPFIDKRGEIQPLVDRLMRSAVLINSKAGSLRANHYHKTDWHYCYIISGTIEYFYRKTGSEKEPENIIARKGQMIFTSNGRSCYEVSRRYYFSYIVTQSKRSRDIRKRCYKDKHD